MYIKKEIIEQIAQLNIIEVLTREGLVIQRNEACCPFHNEKSPSFKIKQSQNMYKCFGCGEAGGPIAYIMKLHKLPFYEAVQHLAKSFNIEIEFDEKKDTVKFAERKTQKDLQQKTFNLIVSFFAKQDKSIATKYMLQRNYAADVLKDWGITISPDSSYALAPTLQSDGHLPVSNALGYTKTNEKGTYDTYRNRMLFPLVNEFGVTVGYAGRRLNDDSKYPKYINPANSFLYDKDKFLFGLFAAKASIKSMKYILIVEGYLDVIRCHTVGYTNAVACCGTALTNSHIAIIKRHTNQVHLWYDGDEAGIKATLKAIPMLLSAGLEVLIVQTEAKDPDVFFAQQLADLEQPAVAEKATLFIDQTLHN